MYPNLLSLKRKFNNRAICLNSLFETEAWDSESIYLVKGSFPRLSFRNTHFKAITRHIATMFFQLLYPLQAALFWVTFPFRSLFTIFLERWAFFNFHWYNLSQRPNFEVFENVTKIDIHTGCNPFLSEFVFNWPIYWVSKYFVHLFSMCLLISVLILLFHVSIRYIS